MTDNVRQLHPDAQIVQHPSGRRIDKQPRPRVGTLFSIRFGPWVLAITVSHDDYTE